MLQSVWDFDFLQVTCNKPASVMHCSLYHLPRSYKLIAIVTENDLEQPLSSNMK